MQTLQHGGGFSIHINMEKLCYEKIMIALEAYKEIGYVACRIAKGERYF
jgi:hypothetical protein